MTDDQAERIAGLLQEIRDNQRVQLERQSESLEVQKAQFEMASTQFERAEKLNTKAEQIQEKSAQMMGSARKVFAFVLPVIILMVIYLTWMLFARF